LSPEAIDRPKDAQAVADGLTSYLDGVQERAQAAERERAVAVARAIEERRRRKVQLALAASVLALLTLGGVGTTYYLQQRAERDRQRVEQAAAVDRVVGHAVTLRDQALAHPEDVSRWHVALAAVEQAEVGDDVAAGERLQDLRSEIWAGLDGAERDRALLDRLVEIRSAEADDPGGSATDAAYAEAYRKAGIDVTRLTPARAGAKIKARPKSVVAGLTAALDDWAAIRRGRLRNAAAAALLSQAARGADPDPWRNELRTALDQADEAAQRTALQGLARKAKFEALGPISLHLLGTGLHDAGDDKLAESVLRRAQGRHPRDVWINYALGSVLGALNRTDEAIRFLTAARAIRPETAHVLAHALAERGDFDEAIAVFCDLLALRPNQVQHLGCLRLTLEERGRSLKVVAADIDRAVAPLREAVRLKPEDVEAHTILGRTLFVQGKLDEAIAEIRAVKRLEPNRRMDWVRLTHAFGALFGPKRPVPGQAYRAFWRYLPAIWTPDQALSEACYLHGNVLRDQGKLDDAIAHYREAIRLQPNHPEAYSALVHALKAQGKLDEEVAARREAIRLKPDDAVAYFQLGGLLQAQCDFAGAIALYRKGHQLGSKQPDWKYPSAQWIAEAEREAASTERFRTVLKGEVPPKDNNERLQLAGWCDQRKWPAAAARFRAEALASDPKLGDNFQSRTRHQATGGAVLAGVGQGEDEPRPDEAARKRFRAQARDWFQADLRLYAKTVESGNAKDCHVVVGHLQHWKVCPDLGPVRDPEVRKKFPAAERKEWQALWDEVEALLKRAQQGEKGTGKQ
jgi:tetratricopeptide (TPR) repeat protein